MTTTTCPDCGAVYAASEHSCPTCGCPNDNSQPQQEEQRAEPQEETANACGDDFNENGQYSPFPPSSWFFSTPWPLSKYPERGDFGEAHPFLGWLFGPWYLTCKSKAEKEEYAVINNVFYLLNLVFKSWAYAVLWAFFKGILFVILFYLLLLFAFTVFGWMAAGVMALVVYIPFGILFLVITACAYGQALHRYWPSVHRTWRRINKRYWREMLDKK